MSETPLGSFIPKQKAAGTERHIRRSNFYIFSIVSFALFIAAPIGSAAVYIYQLYTEKTFNNQVVLLNDAINKFSEADLSRVLDFNDRLKLSQQLLSSHVSLVSLLNVLEHVTNSNIQFGDLKITSPDDTALLVDASLYASSFDAVLFQRKQFATTETITKSTLSGLTFTSDAGQTSGKSEQTVSQSKGDLPPFKLTAKLVFNNDAILYTPDQPAVSVGVDSNASTTTTSAFDGVGSTTTTTTSEVAPNQVSS